MGEAVIGDKSIESLLAELASIKTKGDAGQTANEIIEASGFARVKVMRLLTLAKAQGRLVVGRRMVERLNETMYPATVYRILPTKRTK